MRIHGFNLERPAYEVLGLRTLSQCGLRLTDITEAYQDLAVYYHPLRNPEHFNYRFLEVQAAYDYLVSISANAETETPSQSPFQSSKEAYLAVGSHLRLAITSNDHDNPINYALAVIKDYPIRTVDDLREFLLSVASEFKTSEIEASQFLHRPRRKAYKVLLHFMKKMFESRILDSVLVTDYLAWHYQIQNGNVSAAIPYAKEFAMNFADDIDSLLDDMSCLELDEQVFNESDNATQAS